MQGAQITIANILRSFEVYVVQLVSDRSVYLTSRPMPLFIHHQSHCICIQRYDTEDIGVHSYDYVHK